MEAIESKCQRQQQPTGGSPAGYQMIGWDGQSI